MNFTGFNINFLSKLLAIPLLSGWGYSEQRARCLSLKSTLVLENTTILDVSYVSGGSKLKPHGDCVPKVRKYNTPTVATAPLCRVQFSTNTSDTSSIRAEAWLPDEWYGRVLGIGNGGLGGCISYRDLDYGSALHFATIASNNGHDGDTGRPFLGNPEVLNDFAFRSIHVEAVIGKQIVEAYYEQPHDKAYYLGCSTGGRQGTQAALNHPADWDGIIAGAPATDFNRLLHWSGTLARHLGAPDSSSPSYISPASWKLVAEEILNQCDGIDGVRDGIITEPDACHFRPEALLCSGTNSEKCLSIPQVEALRKIYSPLYENGELIYPRFDPGSEGIRGDLLNGKFPYYTEEWLKYVVLNVTEFDFSQYGPEHGRLSQELDVGGISTFNGDFSAFRDRGGKFLTFHGRVDGLIASGNSKRLYDLISRTLMMPSLDDFYRLFLVPGMEHCARGPGAWAFGQHGGTQGAHNESSHNLLLALVDWVEGGVAPDTITGTAVDGSTRVHCRYPMRSVWDGSAYRCEA